MSAPRAVLAAIEKVSGTVPCEDCNWYPVELEYDPVLDCPLIRHSVRHRFGVSATALAEFINDELARSVAMSQYGEPLPLNVWAVTA